MLQIFKRNRPENYLYLFGYILLLHVIPLCFSYETPLATGSILYDLSIGDDGTQKIIGILFHVLHLLVNAFLINQLVTSQGLLSPPNFLPGLFYVLFSSAISDFTQYSPLLIADSCLIASFFFIVNLYRNKKAYAPIFNLGFLISIASMFYFGYAVFILLAFFSIYVLRSVSISEILQVLVAIVLPYYLLYVGCTFFTGSSELFWKLAFSDNMPVSLSYTPLYLYELLKIILLLCFALVAVFGIQRAFMKKRYKDRKIISLLYMTLAFGALMHVIQADLCLQSELIFAVPLGMILGISMSEIKINFAEIIHFFLLVACLTLQFFELQ